MSSRRDLQLLLLAILFALILIAILLILLPLERAEIGTEQGEVFVESPLEEAMPRGDIPPPEVVARDLLSRPELIPYEGTLGGTMGFYSEENIEVLNEHWVFAQFEDGHVQGSMVLEYSLGNDGELRWTVLAAELR